MSNTRTNEKGSYGIHDVQELSSGDEEFNGSFGHIERKGLHSIRDPERKSLHSNWKTGKKTMSYRHMPAKKGHSGGSKQKDEKHFTSEQDNGEETTEVDAEEATKVVNTKYITDSQKISILGAVVVVLSAVTIYNSIQLIQYGYIFAEINKNVEYLDMLKEMKNVVIPLKKEVENVNERFEPLRNELTYTEANVKTAHNTLSNIQHEISGMNNNIDQLKTDVSTQKNHTDNLTDVLNNLEPRLSILVINVTETEIKVIPAIEKQKQLVKNVSETSDNVTSLQTSLDILNENLAGMKEEIKDVKPSFEYVKEVVGKSKEIEKTIINIDLEIKNKSERVSSLQTKIEEAEKQSKELSQKFTGLQSRVNSSEENQNKLQEKQSELEAGIQSNSETIMNQRSELESIQENADNVKQALTTKTESLQQTLTNVKIGVDDTMTKCSNFRTETLKLEERVKEEEKFSTYVKNTLPNVVGDVDTLKGSVSIPWCSILDILQLVAIIFIAIQVFYPQYSVGNTIQNVNYKYTNDDFTSQLTSFQRPRGILDQIHRAPVLDDKICIVSFYTDTQKLHRSLVTSATEISRRGKALGISQHLVKGDDDILTMPRARYILVFVDYNERNVILENTGQDLGDKKVVTVQAAQKLGADVFVTYVRDKGSSNLFPGHLYNTELSAFTSHPVLKRIENKQRCFSVYESYNNTQKEHIARAIR